MIINIHFTTIHAYKFIKQSSAASVCACSCRSGPQQLWTSHQQHHGQLICQRAEIPRGESLQTFSMFVPLNQGSLADVQLVWLQVLRQTFRGTSTGRLLVWSCVAITFCL